MKNTTKALGFLALLVVPLLLVVVLLRGLTWVLDKAAPFIIGAAEIGLAICVFVLLPMCIFRRMRRWAGVGFYFASWSFGLLLFAYACFFVIDAWGYVALAIGLIFAGVGVVPVALLAALVRAEWSVLFSLLCRIVLTFGVRYLGIALTKTE